uniref:Bg70 protein n=1 Tax=Rhizophora mucronata TaxID=61149 RepID=A0A2P2N0P7_RHIMU
MMNVSYPLYVRSQPTKEKPRSIQFAAKFSGLSTF